MSHTYHSRSHRLKRGKLCAHHTPNTKPRDEWLADCRAAVARGETLKQCPTCLRFLWPDEMGKPK